MKQRSSSVLLPAVLILIAFVPGVSICQTDIFEEFQFNFATPGARANAMGRAFIGLADDATAAQSNPAGLVILTKPEASFELKNTSFSVQRAAGFRSLLDSKTTDFGQSSTGAAFASYVYPRNRLRLAFYRQEFLNYEESFALEERIIPGLPGSLLRVNGEVDLFGVNWGGAVAYRFSSKLYVGFSAKISQLKIRTLTSRFGQSGVTQAEIDESRSGFGFVVGTIVNPFRQLSIGAVYESNPRLEYEEQFQKGGAITKSAVVFRIPDRSGVGIVVRPTDYLTLLSDAIFVRYSQMQEDLATVAFPSVKPDDFLIEDAVELHAGAEYNFFVKEITLAVRAGVFSNPAHDLRYTGEARTAVGRTANALFNFGGSETQIGFTLGGGVVLGGRFQLDLAYLISDPFNEFSTSVIYRFR